MTGSRLEIKFFMSVCNLEPFPDWLACLMKYEQEQAISVYLVSNGLVCCYTLLIFTGHF
jgi:hypothetical protein